MLNCVTLIGRLTADPELRQTTTGKEVCTFNIAVDRAYTKPGEQSQTDFITVVAWGKDALFVSRYFSKGSMIAVQGSLQSNNFTDNKGNKRTSVEVKATELSFCGSKSEGKTQSQAPYDDYEEIG